MSTFIIKEKRFKEINANKMQTCSVTGWYIEILRDFLMQNTPTVWVISGLHFKLEHGTLFHTDSHKTMQQLLLSSCKGLLFTRKLPCNILYGGFWGDNINHKI